MRRAASPGRRARLAVRRAFAEFLAVPVLITSGFVLLAVAMYLLDRQSGAGLDSLRGLLRHRLITDPGATNTLLGTIAGAVITVTSITFSLLMVTVQQSAASLTNQVLDQFLRRRLNQVYFGAFVGVSVFALLTLATNDTRTTPVFAATMALLLTVGALLMLVLLVYTTLNQMRPDRIIGAMHDLTLAARERQRPILARTRRESSLHHPVERRTVRAESDGYIADLDLDRIGRATGDGGSEVVLLATPGDHVCFHDPIAEVRVDSPEQADAIADAVQAAVSVERQPDSSSDPSFGISQLATVAWTSISTAKSNPAPGLAAIRSLRDLLQRWLDQDHSDALEAGHDADPVPLVYPDRALEQVLSVYESLLVVASESMQHQSAAEVLRALATLLDILPAARQEQAEQAALRGISALGDHVLTGPLEDALVTLAEALQRAGRTEAAGQVAEATDRLRNTVGRLRSRGTRANSGPSRAGGD